MALREFIDENGKRWNVWDVYPQLGEQRRADAASNGDSPRERARAEAKGALKPEMARGWLAFEASDGERRRLAPIPEVPDGWASGSELQLRVWCKAAQPVPAARRLVK